MMDIDWANVIDWDAVDALTDEQVVELNKILENVK